MKRKQNFIPYISAAALALAIAVPASLAQKAQEQQNQAAAEAKSHMGEVVGTADGQLTMTVKGENEHSHKVTADTKITINGKEAQLQELKKGDVVEVSMGENNVAAAIKATRQAAAATTSPQREPAARTHREEVVSVSRDQLRATDGQEEHSHKVTAETKVFINGEAAQLQDLQKGDSVEVTLGANDVALAIKATRRAAQSAQPQQAQRQPQPQRELLPQREQARDSEGAVLGIALAPSRGGGVFIPEVAPQGPAQQAGIRNGDYILAINGQQVSAPEQLTDLLSRMRPGDMVRIMAWRDGQEFEATAQLASRQTVGFRGGPQRGPQGAADRNQEPAAWLGVMLVDGDDQRIRIERIHPQGPAAQAGLQQGDILVSIDGTQVADSDAAAELLAEMKPDARAQLVVLRNNQQVTLAVTLGDRTSFFRSEEGQFGEEGEDVPEHFLMLEQHRRLAEQHQRIEEMCQQLLAELQELRKEVQALKKQ